MYTLAVLRWMLDSAQNENRAMTRDKSVLQEIEQLYEAGECQISVGNVGEDGWCPRHPGPQ